VKEISVEITQIHESHAPPELNVVMLACELHDGACQQFVGAAAAFETYRHLLPDDAAGAWKEYELGMSRLRRGIGELRALLSGLRPMYLEGRGLDAALADLVRECEEKHGIKVHFSKRPGDFQVPGQLLITGFRIIQEGLFNICRHGRSKTARVALIREQRAVRIDIEDWGVGFDPAVVPSSCFGLAGIRARAESVGGTAMITSQPGAGTLIAVSLPC
jgi:signal transduction histidine kinase